MKTLKKILYVEDEPDIRLIAVMALESLGGFTLESCETGREAVAKATEFSPDLLLLDVMMPGMDGPTTLLALRNLPGLADTPAVFMTAKVQSQEIDEYLELGAVDVIAKPFDPMTLAARIEDIWRRTQEG
jgi:CheY-like chemotaxis protein